MIDWVYLVFFSVKEIQILRVKKWWFWRTGGSYRKKTFFATTSREISSSSIIYSRRQYSKTISYTILYHFYILTNRAATPSTFITTFSPLHIDDALFRIKDDILILLQTAFPIHPPTISPLLTWKNKNTAVTSSFTWSTYKSTNDFYSSTLYPSPTRSYIIQIRWFTFAFTFTMLLLTHSSSTS